jgi:hypothetical protein
LALSQFRAQKYAVIDHASADNTIVAAVTGKKIRVTALFAVASGGANTLRFESGTGGTALTGQFSLAATTGQVVLPFNPNGWFETLAGGLLNLELSAATSVDGSLSYIEVD